MSGFTSSESSAPGSPIDTPPSSIPSPNLKSINLNYVSEEDKLEAVRIKAEANKAFQQHNYPQAASLYTLAIERNPNDPTLFCNRAYTRMKLEEQGYAIDDATRAIELDPKYVKAYYRRALCQIAIVRPQKAVADLKKVLQLEPHNQLAKTQLEATQKLIRKTEFERAIEIEEEKDAAERCLEVIKDEGGCNIDKSYVGPHLSADEQGGYKMTQDFIESMLLWFKEGKTLHRRYVWEIVLGCYRILSNEESLTDLVLEENMTCDIIGDIHGQFYDMLHLFTLTGKPSSAHCLVFNGDFVDRGSWSVEVVLTLFAYKWLYPNRVKLNRGNHESKSMNSVYGFEGEVKHKHGELTYKLFAHVFTALPLATLVSASLPPLPSPSKSILSPEGRKRYFVVHGGLFSRDGVTLEEIRKIPRVGQQPGTEGLMCEVSSFKKALIPLRSLTSTQLLWTDPQETPGRGPSKRGVGIGFGPDVTRRWCELNGITGILRSHEVRQGGYAIEHDGLCTTVFSAPNYVDQVGNKGAFVRIDAHGTQTYTTFDAREHPPMRPMAYASAMASMMIEEEEETARAYAEYLDTFDADAVSKSKKGGFVKAGGREELYSSQSDTKRKENRFDSYSPSPEPSSGPAPKHKGKRAMDAFLEELKRDEAERENRLRRRADAHGKSISSLVAYENQTGSRDRGDPATSNIFVANLPPNITESVFGNFFAKLGPVGSVKIMWPRAEGPAPSSEGRRPRSGLSGFVSYMKRRDAEDAVREMDGRSYARSRSPRRRRRSPSPDERSLDPDEETLIRVVAHKVKQQGEQFEDVLRSQEKGRPKFSFLWDAKGYHSIYSTDSAEESEKERSRKGRLGKLAKRRFEAMLRGLAGRRGDLARCMAFSLEHADAATEIVDLIVASLLNDGTPVPRKMARLYLICDILHNSAASIPNAWKFRQEFQSRLGLVFDHLSTIYHSFPGRITADSFKAQILAVVEVWEDWIVFPAETTTELRNRLDGTKGAHHNVEETKSDSNTIESTPQSLPPRFKASSFKPAEPTELANEDRDEEPPITKNSRAASEDVEMDDKPMSLESNSDVDGSGMGSDLDGRPMDDVDGEPIDDVDGEPLDDVDGEPLDDVDGESLDDVDGDPID
ncbi:hypothetical protein Clacol_000533 [Clathrus columnatus]|uniref:Serine/threonine-protein phosphatase n=1 Tax=Clathrus columnatus TaxID=1419009 RepID=A0AAV4ZYZ2_9AGAM|nr:hypothetical protein Clacol_000533 [Clathrus columnatus]